MKLLKGIQNLITVFLLVTIGALGGYYFGLKGYEVNVKKDIRAVEIINKENEIPNSVDFAAFWEVWRLINEKHISRPLNPRTLMEGAIAGMVDAIGDPYTSYLNPEQNLMAINSLNGKYEGIGAQLGFDDQDRLIIVAPLDGSPALAAGVQAGDKIIQIAGEDTRGISMMEAVNKIRGEAGSVITLTLFRVGMQEPFDVNIKRDTITLDSVTWEDKGEGVAYIRLSRFGESTNAQWNKSVQEIKTQMPNLKAIILDVRNNPGGFLESSVFIGSEFIDKGVIVKEDFSDGSSKTFKSDHTGRLTDKKVKVVVLINEGSASASEIVSAALKEKRGAILVGKRSFGKGSVQSAESFPNGASLHVTVAKWLTPDGNWVDSQNSKFKDSVYNEKDKNGGEVVGGIKVDYEVDRTQEDFESNKDPQLDKAIEIAKKPL